MTEDQKTYDNPLTAWAAGWMAEHYGTRRTFTVAEGERIREEMFRDLPPSLLPSPGEMLAQLRARWRREEGLTD